MNWFDGYTERSDYINAGIEFIEVMAAKEVMEDEQDTILDSRNIFIEEKYDGTRALLYFFAKGGNAFVRPEKPLLPQRQMGYARCFSRRISVKTDWFCENTDSLPQLRNLNLPELDGTIIDGELLIPGKPFKYVSSALNCTSHEAIERQKKHGEIVLHAFDILYYKGEDVRTKPLHRRKNLLLDVIQEIEEVYPDSPVVYAPTYLPQLNYKKPFTLAAVERFQKSPDSFPRLKNALSALIASGRSFDKPRFTHIPGSAMYDYITLLGGEGVIVKDVNGLYFSKRGREYQKLKAFLTRDVVVIDFMEPTKEYKGKLPKTWEHWENGVAVTKYYAEGWVGNILFGVLVTNTERESLSKFVAKKFKFHDVLIEGKRKVVLEIGECSGFNEAQRKEFTDNRQRYIGSTVEIKANGIFPDTGRMRHPRFLRVREDKSPLACTWAEHMEGLKEIKL